MDLIPWRNKSRSRESESQYPLDAFRNQVENVFERFMRDPWSAMGAGGLEFPQLDVTECDDDVCVRAELPGVRPEDVNIEVTGNTLRLSGEKAEEREEKRGGTRYSERRFGSFSRIVQLPTQVDPDHVDATFKDGVLSVRLNKHAEARPRRIPVKAAQK